MLVIILVVIGARESDKDSDRAEGPSSVKSNPARNPQGLPLLKQRPGGGEAGIEGRFSCGASSQPNGRRLPPGMS